MVLNWLWTLWIGRETTSCHSQRATGVTRAGRTMRQPGEKVDRSSGAILPMRSHGQPLSRRDDGARVRAAICQSTDVSVGAARLPPRSMRDTRRRRDGFLSRRSAQLISVAMPYPSAAMPSTTPRMTLRGCEGARHSVTSPGLHHRAGERQACLMLPRSEKTVPNRKTPTTTPIQPVIAASVRCLMTETRFPK